jgi:hypothetical protein
MAAEPDPRLGPVLLELKPAKGQVGNFLFLTILAIPFVLVVFAPTAPLEVKLGCLLVGLGLLAFIAIMLWRYWMDVFLQEQGIREYRQGRPRSLPYDQVATMFYTSIRIFMHGSYMHTVQKLAIQGDDPSARPLVCTHTVREADGGAPAETATALTQVRDQITPRLAARLLERLRSGESLVWGKNVRITPHGLEILDRTGREELVEWPRCRRSQFEQGTYRIWIDDEEKPRLQINSAEPNFWPIAALIQRFRREAGTR